MNENHKKTVATLVFWCFIVLYMTSIGSSLITFAYSDKKVEIKEIAIASNVFVTDKSGNAIEKLKIKQPKSGLKPATGELDEISKIPHTISSEVGSEGAYSTFYAISDAPYKIYVSDVVFTKGESQKSEVFISLEKCDDECKSLSENEILLKEVTQAYDVKTKYDLLIWLSSFTNEDIVGTEISMKLNVVKM